jgi:hypothetical protein
MKQETLHDDKVIRYNPDTQLFDIANLMGETGILLCFTGYIWDLRCIRYALWLQQYSEQFKTQGLSSTLVLPAHKYELSGFLMSIPQSIRFSLVADPENILLQEYGMDKPGFVLLNPEQDVLNRWYAEDALYIGVRRVLDFLQ